MTSLPDDERYSRQIKAGIDQNLLKNGKVVIVGTGALGSVIGLTLAQAGVGQITLIDMDTIEYSNLNRQILFRESDVGKSKVKVAQNYLQKVNSEIEIEGISERVQELPLSTYNPTHSEGVIVIVDALDNFESRRWLNAVAVEKKLPLISGGMFGHLGNVQLILPEITPCLDCQPLIPERELQKACSPPGEVRRELEEKKNSENKLDDITKDVDYFPALGSVATVVGGIMSHETLKILQQLPHDKLMLEYLFMDLEAMSFIKVPLSRRLDCVVCSSRYKLTGIPFHIDLKENLEDLRNRIQLQFNLDSNNLELIHGAQTLDDDSQTLNKIFSSENPKLYVIAPTIPSPLKLALIVS